MSWSEVKKINSDMSKPLDDLINEKFSAGLSSVKSVQRGVKSVTLGTPVDVPINPVNIAKSIVNINSWIYFTDSATVRGSIRVQLDTESNLKIISAGGSMTLSVAWEVVEFY